jgi:hypothetical protein
MGAIPLCGWDQVDRCSARFSLITQLSQAALCVYTIRALITMSSKGSFAYL